MKKKRNDTKNYGIKSIDNKLPGLEITAKLN